MRVLVTGATGALGRHVVDHLRDAGHGVHALVMPSDRAGARWADDSAVPAHPGDVRDMSLMRGVLQEAAADAVVHLAGVPGVRTDQTEDMAAVNIDGAQAVATACLKTGVRLVHVSSASAVGLCPDSRPIEEDFDFDRHRITHPYPVTKRRGQQRVQDAIRDGLDGVVLNPGAVLLPGDPSAHAWSALPRMLADGLRWSPAGGFGFVGRQTLMVAIERALTLPRSPEPMLLVDQSTSYAALFTMVAREMGLSGVRVLPRPLTSAALGLASLLKSRAGVRIEPDRSLVPLVNWPNVYGGARSLSRLGISPRPLREAVYDLVSTASTAKRKLS